MKRAICTLITWLCLAAVAHGKPPAEPIVGRYLSENKDHKHEVFLRERALHGHIAWTKGPDPTDTKNKDPKLRSRRVAGIENVRGFAKSRNGSWTGGTLSNPEDGGMCEAKLWYSREVKS
jgi:hypothetical protein